MYVNGVMVASLQREIADFVNSEDVLMAVYDLDPEQDWVELKAYQGSGESVPVDAKCYMRGLA